MNDGYKKLYGLKIQKIYAGANLALFYSSLVTKSGTTGYKSFHKLPL